MKRKKSIGDSTEPEGHRYSLGKREDNPSTVKKNRSAREETRSERTGWGRKLKRGKSGDHSRCHILSSVFEVLRSTTLEISVSPKGLMVTEIQYY